MVNPLIQPGSASFSNIFTPTFAPAQGDQLVTNEQDANSQVTPPIVADVNGYAYNFVLGTPGGANDPSEVPDASDDVYPIDDGEPEYDISAGDVFPTLGADGSTDPADLDPATFEAWSQLQQQAYLSAWNLTQAAIGTNVNGGADAIYVSAGGSSMSLLAWSLQQAASIDASLTPATGAAANLFETFFDGDEPSLSSAQAQTILSTPPSELDPATFDSLTPSAQLAYLAYQGVSSGQVVIGSDVGDGSGAIVLQTQAGILGPSITSSTPILTWAGASLNAAASLTTPSSAPLDLGGYGATPPADLDPSIFSNWTSEQQAEYMNYQGLTTAVVGSSVSGATPITAVLSQSLPATVYIVNNLQASDLAQMSPTDLADVEATAEFQNVVGPSLGLTIPASTAQSAITANINSILGTTTTTTQTISNLSALTQSGLQTLPAGTTIPPVGQSTTVTAAGYVDSNIVTTILGDLTLDIQTSVSPAGQATVTTSVYGLNGDGSVDFSETTQTGTAALTALSAAGDNVTPVSTSVTSTGPLFGGADGSTSSATTADFTNSDGSTASVSLNFNDNTLESQSVTVNANIVPQVDGASYASMPLADREVYVQELQLLSQQVASSGMSSAQASSAASAIMQRFDQAAIYWAQTSLSTTTANGVTSGVMSTDNNASLMSAYQTFISQEKAILQAAENNVNLASSVASDPPSLDAPTVAMIALTSSMSSQQAQIEIGTTQLQQLQALLQDVGSLQTLVNNTTNALGGTPSNATVLTTGNQTVASASASSLSPANLSLVEMFSSNIAGISPILKQYGITLPSITLVDSSGNLVPYNGQQWGQIGTALSTLVTELQQQSQTLTTQLNQQTTQENNTYTEMSGIAGQMGTVINTIGTNMAS